MRASLEFGLSMVLSMAAECAPSVCQDSWGECGEAGMIGRKLLGDQEDLIHSDK